ncbi:MAG TPA: hydrogenase maturation protease [Actinopolymorphaceae bacterium]
MTGASQHPDLPWWEPGADDSVSPETDSVVVDGRTVSKGSRVRLRPREHGTDAHDMFLDGRIARVEAVLLDVDDVRQLAVTVEDDPAAELNTWYGRYRYFLPEEVEPLPLVLVAGIGNIFLGDDGFGVEVVGRIDASSLPSNVTVADYGIRGLHLAYELLDRAYDTLIMVDAVPADDPPGTLVVLEVGSERRVSSTLDAHGMSPDVVLRLLRDLGGGPDRVLVVGCSPETVEERIGLSTPVRAAVDEAARMVTALARDEAARTFARVDEAW